MELHQFEWRDFSNMGAFLAFSDYQDWNEKNESKIIKIKLISLPKKAKDYDFAAKSQVNGYEELVVGIDKCFKKLSKSIAVVWHS